MQAMVQKVALQAALIGSMSFGSYIVRHVSKPNFHKYIADSESLKPYSDLCYALNEVSLLQNDELFKLIIEEAESIITSLQGNKKLAPWVVNRSISTILSFSDLMKQKAGLSYDDERLTAAVYYEKDHRENLIYHLESLLHNMLLEKI